MGCYSKRNSGLVIEVARFISSRRDVYRHRGTPEKGESAERGQRLGLVSLGTE